MGLINSLLSLFSGGDSPVDGSFPARSNEEGLAPLGCQVSLVRGPVEMTQSAFIAADPSWFSGLFAGVENFEPPPKCNVAEGEGQTAIDVAVNPLGVYFFSASDRSMRYPERENLPDGDLEKQLFEALKMAEIYGQTDIVLVTPTCSVGYGLRDILNVDCFGFETSDRRALDRGERAEIDQIFNAIAKFVESERDSGKSIKISVVVNHDQDGAFYARSAQQILGRYLIN